MARRPAGVPLRLTWACSLTGIAIVVAAWTGARRSVPEVLPDIAQADWQRESSGAPLPEPALPAGALRGATGVPPAIARDEEPFVGRRNFVERLQQDDYLSEPVRPLPHAAAQAGGSPAPRRRAADLSKEGSGTDCACARLDPACACLPTAPACPVARAGTDEPCRYF